METYGDYELRYILCREVDGNESYVEIHTKLLRPVVEKDLKDRAEPSTSLHSFGSPGTSKQGTSVYSGKIQGRWWNSSSPVYSFSDRKVGQRLQMLMGTKLVYLFDPLYISKLKKALSENYVKKQADRIHERENEEAIRQHKELLDTEHYCSSVPDSMKNHPVYKIYCKKVKSPAKQKLLKKPKNQIYNVYEVDNNYKSEDLRKGLAKPEKISNPDSDPQQESDKGFTLTEEELVEYKCDDGEIYKALIGKSVAELYQNAYSLIGPPRNALKHRAPNSKD